MIFNRIDTNRERPDMNILALKSAVQVDSNQVEVKRTFENE